jgi:hypothetical protein
MCVLATCRNDVPRATPLEYHSKELTFYFVAERGTKLRNIRSNPNVSVAIFLPYKGWNSTKGAQITGKAKIISRKSSREFREGLEAYGWEKTAKEIGINHPLALKLWGSKIHDARLLACFIDDPAQVTSEQMDAWAEEFDSWDICDQVCTSLFDLSPFAYKKVLQWADHEKEFVKACCIFSYRRTRCP